MLYADLIAIADRIYTMDPGRPVAKALAVVGDRIVAVDTPGRIRRCRGPKTRVIEAPKQVIVPGLTDCHAHLFSWALMLDEVALAGVTSVAAALRKIQAGAARAPTGRWLVGNGFDKNACGGRFPTAGELDAVTGKIPACIYSRDWHCAWVNTAGLKRAGITQRTADPPGGQILRDANGRPTGILMDTAMDLLEPVRDCGSDPGDPRVRRLWKRACREFHRYGLTGVHSVDGIEAFSWFQRFAADGTLGLRVRYALPHNRLSGAEALQIRSGWGDDRLRIAGLKLFADGALGSQTAWMYRAYPGRPGYYGIPVCVGNELRDTVRRATAIGLPCWIHAIGDRAVHEVASVLAGVGAPASGRHLPHRIEHAQCVQAKTLRVMRKAKIIASVQPSHLCEDMTIADKHWRTAATFTYPFRSLQSAGILMAMGSDLPVETMNPFLGIYAAVTRKNRQGEPSQGWYPRERIDRPSALAGYTVNAAQSVGDASRLGRLSPGHLADFAVLTDDPLRCPAAELPAVRATHTVVGGQLAWAE